MINIPITFIKSDNCVAHSGHSERAHQLIMQVGTLEKQAGSAPLEIAVALSSNSSENVNFQPGSFGSKLVVYV